MLFATLAVVLPHPGVVIGQAQEKFDAEGKLAHAPTREFVQSLLSDLHDWTLRFAIVDQPREAGA